MILINNMYSYYNVVTVYFVICEKDFLNQIIVGAYKVYKKIFPLRHFGV